MNTEILTQELLVQLDPSWQPILASTLKHEHMQQILSVLCQAYQDNKTVYPLFDNIFHAFRLTPFNQVKVIILGQDPYHGTGQAHGLSFSVPEGVHLPPSLRNIFIELEKDCGIKNNQGNLSSWAEQGVLLLNASLTVEANKPNSHQAIGWMRFTDYVIKVLNKHKENLVFILWGKFAQQKMSLVDKNKHLVITSTHPSPFSAHYGFFGSQPFSQTNAYLVAHGIKEINWQL